MKIICLFISIFLITPIYATDRCETVLKNGVFDEITKTENHESSDTKDHIYCSKDFEKYIDKNKNNLNLGFTVKGIPIKFGFNSDHDNSKEKLREVCERKYSHTTQKDYVSYASKHASKDILNAWVRCLEITTRSNLVEFTHKTNRSLIILQAHFNGVTGLEVPKITDIDFMGPIECRWKRIKKGTKITYEGVKEICKRTGNGEIAIILYTTLGDYEIMIDRDLNGDIAGYFELTKIKNKDVEVSLGRITKSVRGTKGRSCNNSGCSLVNHKWHINTTPPIFVRDPQLDSCTVVKFVSWKRENCKTGITTGSTHKTSIKTSLNVYNNLHLIGAPFRSIQSQLNMDSRMIHNWVDLVFSAEKYRVDKKEIRSIVRKENIIYGKSFKIKIKKHSQPVYNTQRFKLKGVVKGIAFNFNLKNFDPANARGLKLVRINDTNVESIYTFVVEA